MKIHIKDKRLSQVKDRFLVGKIQSLKDIYTVVPRDRLAKEANISVSRFKTAHYKFTVADVRILADIMNLPVLAVFELISKEVVVEPVKEVESIEVRLSILSDRLYLGHLQMLHEVFEIVPRTLVAKSLGTNNNVMGRLIAMPDTCNMRLLLRLALALRIKNKVTFNLIENELRDKEGKKILRLKSQRGKTGARELTPDKV